jgi:hypothetical protein
MASQAVDHQEVDHRLAGRPILGESSVDPALLLRWSWED